ncbi:DUF4282 domain-containing protein [Frischella perrara]|uniref:DUF4282 domain-containing protein n=1 Tax=Frischella perrara TaxID=1267021 RepID=UPI001C646D6F|nr:DUF4282 domain-containing protein [Frischella perrara]
MKDIFDLKGLTIKDLLFFNKMLTPKLLPLFYWIALLCVSISGLFIILGSLSLIGISFFMAISGIISGIITIVMGAISIRIGCELISVLFNINRNIEKVANSQQNAVNVDDVIEEK